MALQLAKGWACKLGAQELLLQSALAEKRVVGSWLAH